MPARDLLLALAIVIVWGVNFMAIKWGVAEVPPLLLTAIRYVVAALPAIFFVRRPQIALPILIAYGVFLGVGQFGFLFSAIHLGMPAGLASLVLQLQTFSPSASPSSSSANAPMRRSSAAPPSRLSASASSPPRNSERWAPSCRS